MIFATTQESIGLVILVLAVLLVIVFGVFNVLSGRAEVGSEIELAANRKPYLDDEALEGRKLDRVLTLGLIGLFICSVGVPVYWLAEPSRQTNAVKDFNRIFVDRGRQ